MNRNGRQPVFYSVFVVGAEGDGVDRSTRLVEQYRFFKQSGPCPSLRLILLQNPPVDREVRNFFPELFRFLFRHVRSPEIQGVQ